LPMHGTHKNYGSSEEGFTAGERRKE